MAKRARARDPRDRVRGSVSCALARFALAFSSLENRENNNACSAGYGTTQIYNPGQKVLEHLPFFTWFCIEFAAILRYTLINTP